MIRNFLLSNMPNRIPLHVANKGELAIIREKIVQSIFLFVAVFSVIALIPLEIISISQKSVVNIISFPAGVLLIALVAFTRRTPYFLRALIIILTLYISSFITYNQYGYSGSVQIYLLGTTILTAIFFGTLGSMLGLAGCSATMLIFSYNAAPQWVSTFTFFIALAGLCTISTLLIINSLSSTLVKQRLLTDELTSEKDSLANRISEATVNLQQRLVQVRTASDISRAISSTLNTQELLQQVVDLIQQRFSLYYVGVFSVDEISKYALLRAGTGEAGRKLVEDGHRLPLSPTSMIGSSIISQIPRISQDIAAESIRFRNPLLPNTLSELALPIQSRGRILGALSIQSEHTNAFKEDDLIILQGIADSLGVALENANLFEQAREDLEEIRLLNKEFVQQSWSEVLESFGDFQYSYENRNAPPKAKFSMEIPLQLRDQTIGSISLETSSEHYDPADIELVEAISTQTALALENARLLDQTQRRAFQEQALNQLTSQFSQAITIEDILKIAVQELGQLPNVTEASIHLLSEESKSIEKSSDESQNQEEPA
jgi:GAF domain-containing protein